MAAITNIISECFCDRRLQSSVDMLYQFCASKLDCICDLVLAYKSVMWSRHFFQDQDQDTESQDQDQDQDTEFQDQDQDTESQNQDQGQDIFFKTLTKTFFKDSNQDNLICIRVYKLYNNQGKVKSQWNCLTVFVIWIINWI